MSLSPLMQRILSVLGDGSVLTPNQIGSALSLPPVRGGKGEGGRGRGSRVFGPAQRIIFPLSALERRGFVAYQRRPDGRSGTAYHITAAGREALR